MQSSDRYSLYALTDIDIGQMSLKCAESGDAHGLFVSNEERETEGRRDKGDDNLHYSGTVIFVTVCGTLM